MHTVKRIRIEGFWGSHTADVDFDKSVNFLIGNNGSGKTTLINALAAAVKLDLDALEKTVFSRINLELQDSESRSIAELDIERASRSHFQTLQTVLRIRFRKKKSDNWTEFDLSEFYEMRRRIRNLSPSARRTLITEQTEIGKSIHELVKLTWLSVHRATLGRRYEDPEGMESTVDRKVAEISTNFVSFLSSLDTLSSKETKTFQEYVFLSLLYKPEDSRSPFDFSVQFDLKGERETLSSIFGQFGLAEKSFKKEIDQHFKAVEQAVINRGSPEERKGLQLNDLVAILDMQRIQKVVSEWQSTQTRIKTIYGPKDSFSNILNSLFINKTFSFDERNRPVVTTREGRVFGPDNLSSGEKQLYIILGEALLQERAPHVFIADEPELSLHVEWQSNLVKNLRQLNPNVQIIFATHSPDIVSVYNDKVIRISERVN